MSEPFQCILSAYKLYGLRVFDRSFTHYFCVYIVIPLHVLCLSLVLLSFTYEVTTLLDFTRSFESFASFAQLFTRKILLVKNAQKYENLIRNRQFFWAYDCFGTGPFSNGLHQKIKFCMTLMGVFRNVCIIAVGIMGLSPLVLEDVKLPSALYIPKGSPLWIVFLYQIEMIFLCEAVLCSFVFDGFFLFLCTELEIQFRLIRKGLEEHQVSIRYKDLKRVSGHHRFLLGMHSDLNEIYSFFFIVQFLFNIATIAIHLFVIRYSSPNTTEMVHSVTYILVLGIQGSLIFFPASNLEIQAEHMVFDIYNIKWHNTTRKIQSFITILLMKAQKPLQMSGNGLFIISRTMYIQIVKMSFSLSTLLQPKL